MQTALHCLVRAARHHGVDVSVDGLHHAYAVGEAPVETPLLLRMAQEAGLRVRLVTLSWAKLKRAPHLLPAMARLANGNWIVIGGPADSPDDGECAALFDPLAEDGEILLVPAEKFAALWTGEIVAMKAARRGAGAQPRFSIRWFIPELLRERRLLLDVGVAAVVLYALGLVTPIFFQLVIDKVLVHEGRTTLWVLTLGAAAALGFEALLTFLRRFLLLYVTSRVDIRVATRTFGHLLRLPMGFFERMSAGVLVKHMQQASRVREFLTGKLFLTVLDTLSLLVFVPVLLLYSVKLTLLVVGFTAVIGLLVAALIGPFRRRLQRLYEIEGQRQSLLVETVHGMRTVKSIAMEPVQCRAWGERSAQAVTTRFQVEKLSAVAQSLTGLLEKLTTLAIVALGALDVFDGTLTVGALVAFNMLAGRVSGPLVQVVTLAHEYQEVALSVRMLGEVMNTAPERDNERPGLRPELRGEVELEGVSFRYGADGAPALDDVSVLVPEGSVFGIVGRSGSGKTTLTRLIQGFYPIQSGVLRIDGFDIREIDLAHLRRNIGVVLQDSFLFRGTVRDNIAGRNPEAGFDQVVRAARLAGAEEFIARLPRGFDTMLEEGGDNLSGGQRQRLAIARALLTDPRLLIFDEATSALDPESEMIIRRSLRSLAKGRTVIIVSHRLATLADADAIVILDRGRIADIGRHDQLLQRCTIYRNLWQQQTRQVA